MIGLVAAWALLGLGLWLLADWWLVPARPARRGRPTSGPLSGRLEALGQVLVEAELEQWKPGTVVTCSVVLGLVAGALAFQQLGWAVPALCWAAGIGSLPLVYIWRKRERLRTARQEQLAPLLERARDELQASQGLQHVLRVLAAGGPPALQPALRRLAQDLGAAEFYATVGGEIVLLVCAVCMGAGYWWMRRMGGLPRARRLEARA